MAENTIENKQVNDENQGNVEENTSIENQSITNNDQNLEQKDFKKDQTEQTEQTKSTFIPEDAFKEFKEAYSKQFADLKKELQGRDRKISELQKIVNESRNKELTEEQLRELEKQKIHDEYHNLFIQQTIAEYNLNEYDKDMNFNGFLFSNNDNSEEMREEITEKGKILREYLDKSIKAGIEKGVNDALAKGYVPKTGIKSNSAEELTSMSPSELGEKARKISSMPAGKEKDELLNKLMKEQKRRLTSQI